MSAIIEREDELPLSERLGTLGVVHLRAIAAVAGYTVSVPESDYDSVDLIARSRRGRRSFMAETFLSVMMMRGSSNTPSMRSASVTK